jgi:vancomycin resistance protein YoaR
MTMMERRKRIALGIITGILTAVLMTGLTAGVYAQRLLNVDTIYPQVMVEGVSVQDLSPEEAQSLLEMHLAPRKEEQNLTLVMNDRKWQIPFEELGFHYFYDEALEEAMKFGRNGGVVQRLTEIRALREQPVNVSLNYGYQEELLSSLLHSIGEEIFLEPHAAEIERVNDIFLITPEQTGQELDVEATRELAHQVLEGIAQEPVPLVLKDIPAYPTTADLRQIETTVGEFSTTFNAGDYGRTANLRQGSGSINGILLLPGESFSFNETTGPRIASAGYQEAPVILMGELVPGIGGGICQVSTTLYNAVLRADLKVIERTNHSMPVSYVPRGQDATVAYGALDLRFENNRQSPVFLESEVVGNRITVRIFGRDEGNPDIDIVSVVTQVVEPTTETRYDHNLYEDQVRVERQARTGYRVVSYKIYRENGREIRREEITRDYYRPMNGIIVKGTKPRPVSEWLWTEPLIPVDASEIQPEG